MLIERIEVARDGGGFELSALVGGLRLWYQADLPLGEGAEPFVPAALLAAMARGQALEVGNGHPLSSRLLGGLARAQAILHAWNAELQIVPVRAVSRPVATHRREVATLFSGGVDSLYSLRRHWNEVCLLILIQGLDIPLDNPRMVERARAAAESLASDGGKRVVVVRTNLRDLANSERLSLSLFHGALVAGVALAVGCSRTYLPSSFSYRDLVPWGTHPLLDHLWSTETSELEHDGAEARRTEKIRALALWPAALRVLRVCYSSRDEYNCGRCEKCLRTMVSLALVGASASSFPALPPINDLRKAPIDPLGTCLRENLELAEQVGRSDVARALRANLRRHELKQLARQADSLLLGGRLMRLLRVLRGDPPNSSWIDCTPRPRW